MHQQFSIFVTKAPYDSRNNESALQFCYAATSSGHTIVQVFFYAAAVHTASNLLLPNSDEVNQREGWKRFASEHQVPLNVCTTAGARRGIVTQDDNLAFDNYDPAFSPVGMIEYFAALKANNFIGIQF